MSMMRSVSMTGSMVSWGMRCNLLFCIFRVSSELRFSNKVLGRTLMLQQNNGHNNNIGQYNYKVSSSGCTLGALLILLQIKEGQRITVACKGIIGQHIDVVVA